MPTTGKREVGIDESNPNRRRFLKAAGAASVVGLAGCTGGDGGDGGDGADGGGDGGDGDGGGDGADGGATTQTEAQGPIRIGSALPQSGPFASVGEDLQRGYETGVEAINEDGGIDGREVELIVRDDESEPSRARSALQQILSENEIHMLWGSITSGQVQATASVAEQEGIPMLAVGSSLMEYHTELNFSWTFVPYNKSDDNAEKMRIALEELPEPVENVGLWMTATAWGSEQGDWFEQVLGDAGYNIAFRTEFSFGTQDFSTIISQSQDAGVEAVLSNPITPDGFTAVRQMESAGWAPKLVAMIRAAHTQAWGPQLGSTGDYVVTGPGWMPGFDGPDRQAFIDRYTSKYDVGGALGIPSHSASGFNVTQLTEQVISNSDSLEPEALRDSLRNDQFETIMGNFGFQDNGIWTVEATETPVGQWYQGSQYQVIPEAVDPELGRDLSVFQPWDER